ARGPSHAWEADRAAHADRIRKCGTARLWPGARAPRPPPASAESAARRTGSTAGGGCPRARPPAGPTPRVCGVATALPTRTHLGRLEARWLRTTLSIVVPCLLRRAHGERRPGESSAAAGERSRGARAVRIGCLLL